MAVSWSSLFRISFFLLLFAAVVTALYTLPVEKILKDFLEWIKLNLGPWGPLVLALSYIPLTVLAVPASILTLGGGYLFGLPSGFLADSIGATIGATAAFLLGKTIFLISGFIVSAILMVCVTKVAKASLEKALAENPEVESILVAPQLPIVSSPPLDLHRPLVIKIDPSSDDHEN